MTPARAAAGGALASRGRAAVRPRAARRHRQGRRRQDDGRRRARRRRGRRGLRTIVAEVAARDDVRAHLAGGNARRDREVELQFGVHHISIEPQCRAGGVPRRPAPVAVADILQLEPRLRLPGGGDARPARAAHRRQGLGAGAGPDAAPPADRSLRPRDPRRAGDRSRRRRAHRPGTFAPRRAWDRSRARRRRSTRSSRIQAHGRIVAVATPRRCRSTRRSRCATRCASSSGQALAAAVVNRICPKRFSAPRPRAGGRAGTRSWARCARRARAARARAHRSPARAAPRADCRVVEVRDLCRTLDAEHGGLGTASARAPGTRSWKPRAAVSRSGSRASAS